MKRQTYAVPVVLDPFTSPNALRAGLDAIRAMQGRDVSLLQHTQLFPWFWSTARNAAASPEEAEFISTNEEGFQEGLKQGHAVLDPTLIEGLTTVIDRDAGLWTEGPTALEQSRRSLRNLWWLGLVDPFIRSYAMSKLGPIAGPIAVEAFDQTKRRIGRDAKKLGIHRLRLIVPTYRKERNGKKAT